jgi:hypothetical protein
MPSFLCGAKCLNPVAAEVTGRRTFCLVRPPPHVGGYSIRRQATTDALNISLAMTPSDTFVTKPVISIA